MVANASRSPVRGLRVMALCAASAACAAMPNEPAANAVEATAPLPDSPLSFMFGEWEGTASGSAPGGETYALTQTERVGPMLDGDVTVIEGRGYDANGELSFNAFAVVAYNARTEAWEMRSYNDGRVGTFAFELTEDGYVWSLPAGPGATIRYTATFEGDAWRQIGEYAPADGPPRQIFEMELTRTAATAWPSGGAVLPTR